MNNQMGDNAVNPIVLRRLLGAHEAAEQRVRELARQRKLAVVSVAGQAGAGRSSLIAATARRREQCDVTAAVIASLRGQDDAELVAKTGLPTVAVEIGRADRLDAAMLEQALNALPMETTGQVLVELIGNLTHPPQPLGERAKVLVVAVGVGQHLPRKYEEIFAWADAVVLNMIDLIPLTDFRLADFEKSLHITNPHAELIPLSCRTGEGVDNWLRWLAGKMP